MYRSSSTKKRTLVSSTNRSTSQSKTRINNPSVGLSAAINNYTTSASAYGSGIPLNSNGAILNHSYISTGAKNNILATRSYGQTTVDTAHRRSSNSSMGQRKSSITSGSNPLTSNMNDRNLHLPNLNNKSDAYEVLHKTPRLISSSRQNSQKEDFDSPPFVAREISKPPVSPLQVPLDTTADNDMSLYYSTKAKDCNSDSITFQLLEERKKSSNNNNNSINNKLYQNQPSKIPTLSKSNHRSHHSEQQIQPQQSSTPPPPSNYKNNENSYDIPHSIEHIGDGLCGLQNLGNTCFMNSILQCLAHIVPLRDYFISGNYLNHLNKTNQKKADLARAFAGLLNDLWSKDSKNKVVAPYDVKTAIGRCSRQFSGYNQQDSHEFLIFLLDYLHDSVNQITNPPKYVEIDDSHISSTDEAAKLWWNNYKERNQSIITELFSGQMHSTITCDVCGTVSNNYDPFIGLPVPLPGGRNNSFSSSLSSGSSVTLEDCLNLFTQSEHLSGMDEVYCRKCKGHKSSTKTNEIYRAPKILIIQLKRFSQASYRRDKLSTSVKIPKVGLDITKHMAKNECKIYDLIGISNHSGSMGFGHYIANCLSPNDNKWYIFNDSHVSSDRNSSTCYSGSDPYVLFYQLRK